MRVEHAAHEGGEGDLVGDIGVDALKPRARRRADARLQRLELGGHHVGNAHGGPRREEPARHGLTEGAGATRDDGHAPLHCRRCARAWALWASSKSSAVIPGGSWVTRSIATRL